MQHFVKTPSHRGNVTAPQCRYAFGSQADKRLLSKLPCKVQVVTYVAFNSVHGSEMAAPGGRSKITTHGGLQEVLSMSCFQQQCTLGYQNRTHISPPELNKPLKEKTGKCTPSPQSVGFFKAKNAAVAGETIGWKCRFRDYAEGFWQ